MQLHSNESTAFFYASTKVIVPNAMTSLTAY